MKTGRANSSHEELLVIMEQTGKNLKRDDAIDATLRRVYEETLQEGIPDRFHELLEALKQQDQQKGSDK